ASCATPASWRPTRPGPTACRRTARRCFRRSGRSTAGPSAGPDSAKRAGPPEEVPHDVERGLAESRVVDQALLVHGGVGQRVSARPPGLHAEVVQDPDDRRVDERLRGEYAQVVREELRLELVGALLPDGPVAV